MTDPLLGQSDTERLVITKTDMPGLFNVFPPGESPLFDLTVGQVMDVCARHGWNLSSLRVRLENIDDAD